MKLRNKKTGKRGDYLIETGGDVLNVRNYYNDYEFYQYFSTTKFYEEWEDYKPAEPLIENEKARKAFVAWVEANGASGEDEVTFEKGIEQGFRLFAYQGDITATITFSNIDFGLESGKKYTVAELRGEEGK